MKRITIILFILFLIQGSCQKEPICLCGVENPKTNLQWLKYRLDRTLCVEVYSLIYNGEEYVIISDCPGTIDGMETFFDCDGNKTCEFGGANAGGGICNMPLGFTYEFYLKNRKLIYFQPSTNPNK